MSSLTDGLKSAIAYVDRQKRRGRWPPKFKPYTEAQIAKMRADVAEHDRVAAEIREKYPELARLERRKPS